MFGLVSVPVVKVALPIELLGGCYPPPATSYEGYLPRPCNHCVLA